MYPNASASCIAANTGGAVAQKNIVADMPSIKAGLRKLKQPNKTESSFGLILEARKQKGEVISYQYEGITIRWGTARYTPDWLAVERIEGSAHHVIWLYECKGPFLFPGAKRRFLEAKDHCNWAQMAMFQKVKGSWSRIL